MCAKYCVGREQGRKLACIALAAIPQITHSCRAGFEDTTVLVVNFCVFFSDRNRCVSIHTNVREDVYFVIFLFLFFTFSCSPSSAAYLACTTGNAARQFIARSFSKQSLLCIFLALHSMQMFANANAVSLTLNCKFSEYNILHSTHSLCFRIGNWKQKFHLKTRISYHLAPTEE